MFKMPSDPDVAQEVLARCGLYGTVSVDSYGDVETVNLMHVWVKVTIDGTDYEFDPSFKRSFACIGGLSDLYMGTAMGYDETAFLNSAQSGATLEVCGVKNLNEANIRSDLQAYSTGLSNYLKETMPSCSRGNVIGAWEIVAADETDLPPALPYTVFSRDQSFSRASVPVIYRTTLRVQHDSDIDETFYSSDIYGRCLSLSYNGSLQPELHLEGALEATGTSRTAGQECTLILSVDHPYHSAVLNSQQSLKVNAGGYYVVVNGWGDTGTKILGKYRNAIKQKRFEGYGDTSAEILGDAYTLVGLTWLAQTSETRDTARYIGRTYFANVLENHHYVGIAGQYTAPLLNIPSGMMGVLDTEPVGNPDPTAIFLTLAGHANAYQHAILEQLQDTTSVSAIKLIDLANEASSYDRLFECYSHNWNSKQAQLQNYSQDSLDLIGDYIADGFRVYLPENGNLTVDNWSGTGFFAYQVDTDMLCASYVLEDGIVGSCSSATTDPLNSSELMERSLELDTERSGVFTTSGGGLSIGQGGYPYGLSFSSSYSSHRRFEDGPLGLGWTHNFNISAKVTSNSFRILSDESALDAVPLIVTLYIGRDLRQQDPQGIVPNASLALGQIWLMEQIQEEHVTLTQGDSRLEFIKNPAGHYQAPPGMEIKLAQQANGNFRLKDTQGTFNDFDDQGRLSQWSDAHGNVVDLSYDASGKLTSVVSRIGGTVASRSLTFSYTGDRLTTVTDSANRSVSYTYDGNGQLLTYTNPDNETLTYAYDSARLGLLTETYSPLSSTEPVTTNVFDSCARLVSQIDACGNAYDFFRAGFRFETLEPAQMNPDDPTGPLVRYSTVAWHDHHGCLLREIDQMGREKIIEHDGHYRMSKIKPPYQIDKSILRSTSDNQEDVTVTIDPKPGYIEDPLSYSKGYRYYVNAEGRWFKHQFRSTGIDGKSTYYHYDYNDISTYGTEKGNLMKIAYPAVDTPSSGPVTPVETFTYNAYGQSLTSTGKDGLVTAFEYDTPTNGAVLLKTIVDYGDATHQNITTEITYDNVGRAISTKDALGNISQIQYSNGGKTLKTIAPAPFSYETTFEYYADGRAKRSLQQTTQGTLVLSETTYTACGQTATVRGPYPLGTTDPSEYNTNFTQYEYDALGRTVKVTDAEGNISETVYLPDGKVWKQINAEGHVVIENVYNDNGSLQEVRDAKGNVTVYDYTGFMETASVTYEDGTSVSPQYDNIRRITELNTRGGDVIRYTYNSNQRLESKILPDDTISYTYDFLGRVLTTTDKHGTTSNTYDDLGRLTQVDYPNSRSVAYEYDVLGRRTKLTYPDSTYITYEYDELGRTTAIKDQSGTALASYEYDEYSRRSKLTYANGTFTEYEYDAGSRLLSIDHTTNSASDPSYHYTYDDVGNRLTMLVNGNELHTYTYDKIYQITNVDYPARYSDLSADTAFNYDPVGNRSSVLNDATTFYTTNKLNQYTQVSDIPFGYDDNGNLIYDGCHDYEYDALNRLRKVTKNPYVEDGEGPLGTATETHVPLTTGGDADWAEVQDIFFYKSDSARSGTLSAGQTSYMEAQVFGESFAQNFTFHFKALCGDQEATYRIKLDGDIKYEGDVSQDWVEYQLSVSSKSTHTIRWEITNHSGLPEQYMWVDKIVWNGAIIGPPDAYAESLDTTVPFTSGGDNTWYAYEYYTVYHGSRSVVSDWIDHNQETWLQTQVTVANDATISFYWKTSSESGYDKLRFYLNGSYKHSLSGQTDWEYREYSVTPGTYTLKWTYSKDGSESDPNDCAWLDYLQIVESPAPPPPPTNPPVERDDFMEALDTDADLNFTGGGDLEMAPCYTEWHSAGSYDSIASDDALGHDEESWLEATLECTQTETLSFWWKVSSEEDYDLLEFEIDGVSQTDISGEVDWQYREFTINPGTHTVRWVYSKDYDVSDGDDRAWIDELSWSGYTPPRGDPENWTTATYEYDDAGRRISKSFDDLLYETYCYDGDHVLAEYDHTGALLRKYVYGPGTDQPICMTEVADNGAVYYYHADGLGSIVALSDVVGNTVQTYDYTLYGQVAASDTSHPNPYMFTGRRFDKETGLYYYRARMYDPHTGRFLQTDPIGYQDGINWYAYCGNNPGNYMDPTGKERKPDNVIDKTTLSFEGWDDFFSILKLNRFRYCEEFAAKILGIERDQVWEEWNLAWTVEVETRAIGPDFAFKTYNGSLLSKIISLS